MFTFCDFLHETKHKQYGLEIIFNLVIQRSVHVMLNRMVFRIVKMHPLIHNLHNTCFFVSNIVIFYFTIKFSIRSRPIFKHKQQTLSLLAFNTNTVALSRHYQVFTDSSGLKDSGEVSAVLLHVSWLDLLFSCQHSQPLGKA